MSGRRFPSYDAVFGFYGRSSASSNRWILPVEDAGRDGDGGGVDGGGLVDRVWNPLVVVMMRRRRNGRRVIIGVCAILDGTLVLPSSRRSGGELQIDK